MAQSAVPPPPSSGPRSVELRPEDVIPAALENTLRPHQKEGIQFMLRHCMQRTGCILAHSMGLGKTAQVVVLCAALFRSGRRTVLVLTPKSTIMNWEVEFKSWSARGGLAKGNPCMLCYRVDDNDIRMRAAIIDRWHNTGGALFIGYEQYCNLLSAKTREKVKGLAKALSSPGPDVLICDEGHRIKSASSHTTSVLEKIKTKARVILTGTPIQNNLMEYFAMIHFVRRGFFTKLYFHDYFMTPIAKGQMWDAKDHEIRLMKDRAYILTQEVRDFILRRDQSILKASLPAKREYVVFCPLSEFQQEVYAAFKEAYFAGNNKRMNLMAYIMALNKIGAHPDLLHNALKKREGNEFDSKGWADNVIACFQSNGYVKQRVSTSPKLLLCMSLYIAHSAKRQKMLIFSQYIDTLDYVEKMLKSCITGLVLFRLDGSLATAAREAAIKGFQAYNGACVFLISTKAGGVGVNLNTAHCAVLYDVSFNPAIDQQAVFRCYRYGQKNPVTIYRLVSDGTPEALIYNRCVSKEWMSRKVIDEDAPTRDFVTTVDLKSLFKEERGEMEREDPPHVVERWIEERELCLSQAAELSQAVGLLEKKNLSVSKVHRHESLLVDKASESTGTKEILAYKRYKEQNGGDDEEWDREPEDNDDDNDFDTSIFDVLDDKDGKAARDAQALDADGFDVDEMRRVLSMSMQEGGQSDGSRSKSSTPPPEPGVFVGQGRRVDSSFDLPTQPHQQPQPGNASALLQSNSSMSASSAAKPDRAVDDDGFALDDLERVMSLSMMSAPPPAATAAAPAAADANGARGESGDSGGAAAAATAVSNQQVDDDGFDLEELKRVMELSKQAQDDGSTLATAASASLAHAAYDVCGQPTAEEDDDDDSLFDFERIPPPTVRPSYNGGTSNGDTDPDDMFDWEVPDKATVTPAKTAGARLAPVAFGDGLDFDVGGAAAPRQPRCGRPPSPPQGAGNGNAANTFLGDFSLAPAPAHAAAGPDIPGGPHAVGNGVAERPPADAAKLRAEAFTSMDTVVSTAVAPEPAYGGLGGGVVGGVGTTGGDDECPWENEAAMLAAVESIEDARCAGTAMAVPLTEEEVLVDADPRGVAGNAGATAHADAACGEGEDDVAIGGSRKRKLTADEREAKRARKADRAARREARREEKELQRALKASAEEYAREQAFHTHHQGSFATDTP